ncbi:hypothetical protein Hena1_02340 [Erwinia phage Hena1]|uniref:HTH gntR-type domain-containing protein n=1 Tax=Erwinia phage Hena1 TaxID=2678601 RepID=A0A6B9J8H4_9CAUD|nr:replication initiation protein [Erwinia phage Hena1]QGZ16384.1 hypothetical protein Hena1_02340 [Erwinia phage Hena1]
MKTKPYVLCPIALLSDRKVSSFSKELVLYIKHKHQVYRAKNKDAEFFQSMQTMAEEFGVTERTVRRAVDSLCEAGWLEKRGGGQKSPLFLTPTF